VEDNPNKTTSLQDELLVLARDAEARDLEYGVIPRLDFYQRAKQAYAVVHTLEEQPYGCFILHKGVIFNQVG
jgi:L-fucose mutarotase